MMQQSHRTRRRFGGLATAFALGTTLALSPVVASSAPATTSLGTAPLAVASAAPSGPVAGFEDNAARAVYWLAEKVESDGWTLDRALAVAGAGYAEAVREEVLDWVLTDGLTAAGDNAAYLGKLAQIIGIYGQDPATYIPGKNIEDELRQAVESGSSNSIYTLPFIVWGLAYTDAGVPQSAVDYLVSQQCDNGLFGFGCNDTDTSGWVIQALLAADIDPQDEVIQDALEGFAAHETEPGGYVTNGQSVANTNSSAIIAQVLRAAGDSTGADEVLSYIANIQIGWVGTAAAPVGQIAMNQSQFDGLMAGNAAPTSSVNMVMSQVPTAFGSQPFGQITAEGSNGELPQIPLIQPNSYGQTDNEAALLTAHWLQEELNASDGLMNNYGNPDWGITLDALQSLAAAGTGLDAAESSLKRFASEGTAYLDNGISQVAKATYTLLVYGKDPRTFFADRDLLTELEAALDDTGALGENVSAIGQSYAILALERTTNGVPSEALEWLAEQQCSDTSHVNFGGFGVPFGEVSVCEVVDADTTGLAVQALNVDPGENLSARASNDQAIAAAVDWLTENLNADGAIEAWGDTSVNSTAWAAQALGVFGEDAANSQALAFLNDAVLTADDVLASDALRRADIGLIPSSSSTRATAMSEGTAPVLDSARFATAQALLGMTGRGMSELTAAGASALAPTPEFDEPDTNTGGGGSENESGKGNGQGEEASPAIPQKQQPSYAG